MARRALVIALDGTTFDLIGPWMDDGSMPNLARLRDEGVSGPLRSVFPPVTATAWSTFMTAKNPGMTLCLAVNYGGRTEIAEAARRLAADVRAGRIDPEGVDEATFASYLSTSGMPDPDLLTRTAGELRVSNFLLWQISYAELWITDVLWPDFRADDLHAAMLAYARRQRKFGGLPAPA